ncbi:ImmA/IrrE family metallo-endopeptidase [Vibrio proteolyticus]|uniref:IrrE N-terminal-like domain-containing protein n=1 Tax=Vibrio proteolyticus NBRC 13287 TaxID=1219065 RepID=U3BGQ3_VIBPR|nr:ImmA/IrrE family metallo-endopeptidase [Vibrio proteolyticus]GAD68834.1 hypothetical protein VPR01S_20_00140 [Vibrio proteolyticus NBRC 13287]
MKHRKLGNKVTPLSRDKIKMQANRLRNVLGIAKPEVDVCRLLDIFMEYEIASYEVVEDDELGEEEAVTYPDEGRIVIKQSIYDGAAAGDGHCRFTIAHEFGHLFLHKNQIHHSYARNRREHKVFEDSEWQADEFASAFLIDDTLINASDDIQSVAEKFGVSRTAAGMKLKKIR